jgi:diguanylate cyclase (GGDEF)-like protein
MRVVFAFAVVLAFALPAQALTAIEVGGDAERIDIMQLGQPFEGRGDSLQIDTAPGADGISGRMAVRAATQGTSPNWFVFALRNSTDKPVERWLVAERYNLAGSGVIWPDLDSRRIDAVTPSIGFVPERLPFDGADAFRLTLEPGQTITFAAELAGDRLPRMQVWKALDYEKRSRNRQLFQGILLGITGLLAIFLTTIFAANHKAIFPSAALFTWCVLCYLCVDFGFWHKLFNVRPEENAQYRAAGEAAMAATLLVFMHTFLRLGRWHGFIRMLLGLWMVAQFTLVGVAFLDPRLAATFARLSMVALTGVGGVLTLYLALRGQDRALSIVPTWILLGVWLFASALILTGRLGGDFIVNGWTAGLVLLVVLVGFTVTQYAFRSIEPTLGMQTEGQNLSALAIIGTGAAVFEWNARRDEIRVGPMIGGALGRDAVERNDSLDKFAEQLHPADRERLKQLLNGLKDRGSGEVRFDFRMRHVDNSYRWFELEATALPATDRRLVRAVGLVREVTDAKRAQDRLMHDAVHDSLTSVPNRALFLDRLGTAVMRARSEPLVRPLVILVALDRFKSVNSSFGLVVGDSLLITVARRLQRLLGPADTLGRIGGDQFALIFPAARDERESRLMAEDVRTALKGPIQIGGQEVILTGSIGIAEFDSRNPITGTDLMSRAEIAMHRAKAHGPDQIERFVPAMAADKDDRISLESELHVAIEKKQLKLLFQPIIYLRTEQLAGFEALVRWEHPRLGLLNPAEFVPLAEESDLIVKLGSYVLQAAVVEAQRWHKELPRPDGPLFVSVNVSSRQLFKPDLVNEVRHIMGRGLLPKGTLRLEITETLVMENPEQATKVLDDLAAAGAILALDDFGTGYSSLCYLNTFPFATIKIDRALVHTSSNSGSSTAILRSIVALAHELGKTVVAEGVETEEDVGLLRTIGCEHAQGFLYGEPIGAREVIQFLKSVRKTERRLKRGGLFRLRSRRIDDEAEATGVEDASDKPVVAKPRSAKRPPQAPAASDQAATALPNARLRPANGAIPPAAGAVAQQSGATRAPPLPGKGLSNGVGNGASRPVPQQPVPNGAMPPAQSRPQVPSQPLSANTAATPQPPQLRPAQTMPVTAPVPPRAVVPAPVEQDQAALNASRSLARLQIEMSRPIRPMRIEPSAGRDSSPPVDSVPGGGATPPPPIPPPPRQVVPPPDLSTLPPAIAASLARLAGVKPPVQPTAPDAESPPPKKQTG